MRHMFRWPVVRWILLGILLILIAIQFVPVDRVNPPVETEVPAPAPVRIILRRACYDCHSNESLSGNKTFIRQDLRSYAWQS
jgi:hypothetical protein